MATVGTDQRKILLVEDNPNDVALTLRAFKKNKIANEVIVAKDGVEAMDYLFGTGAWKDRNLDDLPVVVLLDLRLPKVDGLELIKRIRMNEVTKLLPVVVLTSSKEDQDLATSYLYGANSYVRKPVDFDQFVVAVQQLGLYWLVLNEPPPIKV